MVVSLAGGCSSQLFLGERDLWRNATSFGGGEKEQQLRETTDNKNSVRGKHSPTAENLHAVCARAQRISIKMAVAVKIDDKYLS